MNSVIRECWIVIGLLRLSHTWGKLSSEIFPLSSYSSFQLTFSAGTIDTIRINLSVKYKCD